MPIPAFPILGRTQIRRTVRILRHAAGSMPPVHGQRIRSYADQLRCWRKYRLASVRTEGRMERPAGRAPEASAEPILFSFGSRQGSAADDVVEIFSSLIARSRRR
jgi:hypothetical protein